MSVVRRLRDAVVRRRLERRFIAAVEAHKKHRAPWRRDPDGIYRCPQCYPEPPKEQR